LLDRKTTWYRLINFIFIKGVVSMKPLMSFLLLITGIAHAQQSEITEIVSSENAALIKQYQSRSCCPSVVDCNKGPRGKRGKRGKRGRTGVTGITGATGPIAPFNLRDELFINAPMMTNIIGETPDTIFTDVYGVPTVLSAWAVVGPFDPINPIGTQFIIPNTLDVTQPVTLIIHCFNIILEAFGDVRFQVQIDYKGNGQDFGINPPANGYSETLLSGDYTVINPLLAPNGRYFTIAIPLNPALMAGKTWSELVLNRIPTISTNNYQGPVFLTAFSIQYTKTNS
jgi:hypothetical protein